MKIRTILFCLLSSLLLQPLAYSQGPLLPPGPPGPTMKALDEVEPRVNIQRTVNPLPGDTTYKFIINTRGSYYLSANLDATNSGIHVTVPGVTIDLNGFAITGSGAAGVGISVDAAANNCTIKNGSITGFGGNGISAAGSRGGVITDVIASNCSVGLVAGDGWRVDNCNAHDNTVDGINSGNGCTISHCSASNNAGNGISTLANTTLQDCSASGNQGVAGISTASGCALTHCTASANTSAGTFSFGILTGAGCTVTGCTAEGNTNTNATSSPDTGVGISTAPRSTIQNCSVSGNKGDGIRVFSDSIVLANSCARNGNGGDGAGVRAVASDNRIEANNVTLNDRGIDVGTGAPSPTGNLIVKNSASGNTINYAIAPSNRYGPIIDITATGTAGVNGSSAASTVVSNDPWANFSY